MLAADENAEGLLIAKLRGLAPKLCAIRDPIDKEDGWPILREARRLTLDIARFQDRCFSTEALHLPSDHFLLVAFLFRRLFNDAWKMFTGDSGVRIGHGVEQAPAFRDALLDFLHQLGTFLQQVIDVDEIADAGYAMQAYRRAVTAHCVLARACEAYLAEGAVGLV